MLIEGSAIVPAVARLPDSLKKVGTNGQVERERTHNFRCTTLRPQGNLITQRNGCDVERGENCQANMAQGLFRRELLPALGA